MDIYRIALIILIIGGINVGIFGLLQFDIIGAIFSGLSRLLYIIIGASAAYVGVKTFIFKDEK